MVYEFKEDARTHGDPQKIGGRLERLRKRRGFLDPEDVVTDAEDPKSPLHDQFEWDDSLAAHQHRLDQARRLIRCIVSVDPDVRAVPYRTFVHIREGGYQSTRIALSDVEMREQVLMDALAELKRFQAKYKDFMELADVIREIQVALAAAS